MLRSQPAAMMRGVVWKVRRRGPDKFAAATVVGPGVRYFTGGHGAGTRDDAPVRTQAGYNCCSRAKRGGRVLLFVPAAYARAFGMYGVSVRSALRVLGGCSAAFCLGYAAPAILATKVRAACMSRRRHSLLRAYILLRKHILVSNTGPCTAHEPREPVLSRVFLVGPNAGKRACTHESVLCAVCVCVCVCCVL
jgi:hypothetical protein